MIDLIVLIWFGLGFVIGHTGVVDSQLLFRMTKFLIFKKKYIVYSKIYPKKGTALHNNCIIELPFWQSELEYTTINKALRECLKSEIKPDDPLFLQDCTIVIKSLNCIT